MAIDFTSTIWSYHSPEFVHDFLQLGCKSSAKEWSPQSVTSPACFVAFSKLSLESYIVKFLSELQHPTYRSLLCRKSFIQEFRFSAALSEVQWWPPDLCGPASLPRMKTKDAQSVFPCWICVILFPCSSNTRLSTFQVLKLKFAPDTDEDEAGHWSTPPGPVLN